MGRAAAVIGMLLTEAGLATALGGFAGVVLGVLLMRVTTSLVYADSIGIPFGGSMPGRWRSGRFASF